MHNTYNLKVKHLHLNKNRDSTPKIYIFFPYTYRRIVQMKINKFSYLMNECCNTLLVATCCGMYFPRSR